MSIALPTFQYCFPDGKPKIIGIYGVSGCGKTTLINELKTQLGHQHYLYYDGSELMLSVMWPGATIVDFQQLPEPEKVKVCEQAMLQIQQDCRGAKKAAVVAGHLILRDEAGELHEVCTKTDLKSYTHIVYLEVPADEILKRRNEDENKERPPITALEINVWQRWENLRLQKLCFENKILFYNFNTKFHGDTGAVTIMIRDFVQRSEEYNMALALRYADCLVQHHPNALVLDADKSLAPQDTGAMFWSHAHARQKEKEVFTNWKYTYQAFYQAMLLHEEYDYAHWAKLCTQIASKIQLYPEMKTLIENAINRGMTVIVLTCGLGHVWQKVLRYLGPNVHILGGKRIQDGCFVTPEVKKAIVERLKLDHGKTVIAVGDSEVDLPMLKAADHAYLVVGKEDERSTSIDKLLPDAFASGLECQQILFPQSVSPRFDAGILPVATMYDIEADLSRLPHAKEVRSDDEVQALNKLKIVNAENCEYSASQILTTPMRNAQISGPSLRKHHQNAGYYLTIRHLSALLGTEDTEIDHVTGYKTTGYRFKNEKYTIIVAMMRGGEPMALGVSEAMPQAMFFHAKNPTDLKSKHIEGLKQIILVDSVINTGESIRDLITYIRKDLDSQIPIIVVAGVVQADFAKQELDFAKDVTFVALRFSDTKFKGKGGTDTGHRLFNSTHLD